LFGNIKVTTFAYRIKVKVNTNNLIHTAMKAFRIEAPAINQLKNSALLTQLIEEYGGEESKTAKIEVMNMLLDMYAKQATANGKRSEWATNKQIENRAIKNEGGKVLSANDRIADASKHLPALFDLQMRFKAEVGIKNEIKEGFYINASLLADCFFGGQFTYGQKMYDANVTAIDKANAKAHKAFKFDVDETGAVNVRKANGGLKGAYILQKDKGGFATQGEYLVSLM